MPTRRRLLRFTSIATLTMTRRTLLDRLLGRRRYQPSRPAAQPADTSIRAARVGDVVVVRNLDLEYDDAYLVIERIHRYVGNGMEWREAVASDGRRRLWVEWSFDREGLFVTAATDRRPASLEAIGLTEDDLVTLDEEHSIGNGVIIDGRRYSYRNSFEAFYHQDNRPGGEGFYLWEFMADDGQQTLAVTKFEGTPYEAYFSDVIAPDDALLYPGERPETEQGRR